MRWDRRESIAGLGRSRPVAALLTVTVLTAACASTRSVTVRPTQGQEAEQIERDRAECDAQAECARDRAMVLVVTLGTPLVGAAVGASFGAFLVFASNTSIGSGDDASRLVGPIAIGAAVGLAVGSVAAPILGAKQLRKQEQAYLDRYTLCLGRRGYSVTP